MLCFVRYLLSPSLSSLVNSISALAAPPSHYPWIPKAVDTYPSYKKCFPHFLLLQVNILCLVLCVPLFLITCLYRPDLFVDNILLFGGNIVITIVSYYVNSSALATRRGIVLLTFPSTLFFLPPISQPLCPVLLLPSFPSSSDFVLT